MKISSTSTVLILMTVMILSLSGCGNNRPKTQNNAISDTVDTHNSRNSLDYEGTYTGTIPCADCSGIKTELTLHGDTYTITYIYEGKGNDVENTFTETGSYTWDKSGSIITLDHDTLNHWQVAENMLLALDDKGKQITGDLADMYILRKKLE
ncbi:MAG: copper resistance protein NlpE [Bacteroides sp.]|nr:copper resistance protein NlpE [Bacteroides sp.]